MNVFKFCFTLVLALAASRALATEVIKDVAYYEAEFPGSGDLQYRAERCRLDIYVPDKEAGQKLPSIVWFHGGGLSGGSKQKVEAFTDHRIIVVAVNYRLMPRAKCPDFIEDAAAAVAWTFKNIEKHGGDKSKINVGGHSAGGYLTMMIGMNPEYLTRHKLLNTDIAAIYPVSGQATTHFAIAEQGQPRPANQRRDNPITINEFAPLRYTNQKLPPIHLLCGEARLEWPARVEENALLAAMIGTVTDHNVIEFRSFAGTDHGSCIKPAVEYIWKSIADEKP